MGRLASVAPLPASSATKLEVAEGGIRVASQWDLSVWLGQSSEGRTCKQEGCRLSSPQVRIGSCLVAAGNRSSFRRRSSATKRNDHNVWSRHLSKLRFLQKSSHY